MSENREGKREKRERIREEIEFYYQIGRASCRERVLVAV